ncbi:YdcF family protein [candidate division KSB1 bacterium]|nr:YdcF family protein [candidate division KSB1 bacterium]
MYLFTVKLFDPFILLFLINALAVANLWRKRTEVRKRLIFLTTAFILLTLFCLPVTTYFSAGWLEGKFPKLVERPLNVKAIVVLSGGTYQPKRASEKHRLSGTTLQRCIRASELYHQESPCPVVVSGGKVNLSRHGVADSHLMKEFLLKMGVTEKNVIVEDKSMDTYENALESYRLLKQKEVKTIALVTDAIHLYRANLCFQKQGFNVVPAGCYYRTPAFRFDLFQFLPNISAAQTNHAVFHEILGLIWFKLRGRI